MIRALNILPLFPYPPRSGADLRAWNLYRRLAPEVQQTLVCRSMNPIAGEHIEAVQGPGIEVVNLHIPRPSVPAKLMKGLRFLFSRYPVWTGGWYFPAMHRRLERLLTEQTFDIILVGTAVFCSYWPMLRKARARKVLDLYDLMGEFLERQAGITSGPLTRLDVGRMKRQEARMIREADMVLVTSERERQNIRATHGTASVSVVPNGVDIERISLLPRVESREILFVGSFSHYPNVDAVLYFSEEVWPLLREQIPEVTLRIVGKSPTREVLALSSLPGIHVTGEVEDVTPYYRDCAACVVPLRAGGGTRLKILEALAFGRPVVTTTLGCEGLELEHEQHLLIADQPDDMCAAVARVLNEEETSNDLVRAGRAKVEQTYGWQAIAHGLLETYGRLVHGA